MNCNFYERKTIKMPCKNGDNCIYYQRGCCQFSHLNKKPRKGSKITSFISGSDVCLYDDNDKNKMLSYFYWDPNLERNLRNQNIMHQICYGRSLWDEYPDPRYNNVIECLNGADCVYYQKGCCQFSHVNSNKKPRQVPRIISNVCKYDDYKCLFNKQGRCNYYHNNKHTIYCFNGPLCLYKNKRKKGGIKCIYNHNNYNNNTLQTNNERRVQGNVFDYRDKLGFGKIQCDNDEIYGYKVFKVSRNSIKNKKHVTLLEGETVLFTPYVTKNGQKHALNVISCFNQKNYILFGNIVLTANKFGFIKLDLNKTCNYWINKSEGLFWANKQKIADFVYYYSKFLLPNDVSLKIGEYCFVPKNYLLCYKIFYQHNIFFHFGNTKNYVDNNGNDIDLSHNKVLNDPVTFTLELMPKDSLFKIMAINVKRNYNYLGNDRPLTDKELRQYFQFSMLY